MDDSISVDAWAGSLPPGQALVLGCGEGADAVWLAERGWKVTGVDASPDALARARQQAGEAGVADRTTWVQADPLAGDPLPGGNDLVSAVRLPLGDADLERARSAAAAAVRAGGTLLLACRGPAEPVLGALGAGWQVDLREPHDVAGTVVIARRDA